MGSLQTEKTKKSLKPGDKVLLKKLDSWITAQDAAMTVKQIGDYSPLGVAYGALCEWVSAHGHAHEKVYPVDDIIPI